MVCAVTWGPSEDVVISGGCHGNLGWWDVSSGAGVRVREAHQGTVQTLRRSPDVTRLASYGDDRAILLWDIHSSEHLQTLRHDRPYDSRRSIELTGVRSAWGMRAVMAVSNVA